MHQSNFSHSLELILNTQIILNMVFWIIHQSINNYGMLNYSTPKLNYTTPNPIHGHINLDPSHT